MSSFDNFSQYLHSFLSANEAETLTKALAETEPVVSVRRNSRKTMGFASAFEPVPWCSKGAYLSERAPFTFDPLLHAGCYYVQDASSMIYEYIVSRLRSLSGEKPVKYLDLCAAPGGKTTAALDALQDDDFVVANEINTARARILSENITKWGAHNCYLSSTDSAKYAKIGEFFDIIVVDAPCSGEGMMRKDDDAVAQWSESLIKECAARQREIIDNAWQSLLPGGYLIYSTCTFNRLENEDILNYLIDEYEAESIDMHLESM
ncbi:MAG: RsmB/NOP family class I SAM-dependent RNA methyltransferase, partial [Muribaculaceae bacterium]|nr:RsmB/NOP family class I SAM-dependent RNA methyltransferase [Muribaculaceae bacterium]